MIQEIFKEIKKRRYRRLARKPVSKWPILDRMAWEKRYYKLKDGYTFDILNPVMFREKIAWYKLFYRHPDMTRIYDKYLLKGYTEEKLGPGHTVPLYGMWTDVRDLERDWDGLPDTFCLKSNCSSFGDNIRFICDKNNEDAKALFREVKAWLDPMNTGINTCSRGYCKVTPRIIAEQLLTGSDGWSLDYKVMCFNGKPDHIVVCGMNSVSKKPEPVSFTVYDLLWNKLPITVLDFPNIDVPRPRELDTMLCMAEKLSQGFPFIRTDFYVTENGTFLGKLALYASFKFDQKDWNRLLGEKFLLPKSALAESLKALRTVIRRLRRFLQKPVSQWPAKKRIAKAMREFETHVGGTFDLDHPASYTEKRVWYQLFYDHPDMNRIYDKYLFKDYIKEKLGPGYTAPLYGMWTSMRRFRRDWDSLPDSFCLKSNCSSLGRNVEFIRDKKSVDTEALFRKVKSWLDPMNTGHNSPNRAYYGVTPRIIAEQLLERTGGQLYDYKVMCFGGKADHILATADRFPLERGNLAYTFYDLEWNKLPVTARGHENRDIPRPEHLKRMVEVAEMLSGGFPHVRVDFYDMAERIYVGEMTFYNTTVYEQREWDLRLGSLFILPDQSADS